MPLIEEAYRRRNAERARQANAFRQGYDRRMLLAESMIWGMPRGDFAVAAGTLALAIFTGILALITWLDVRDTHRLADTAHRAHKARYEPFLLATSVNPVTRADGVIQLISFVVRNVGVGPALYLRANIVSASDPGVIGEPGSDEHTLEILLVDTEVMFSSGDISAFGVRDESGIKIVGIYLDRTREETYRLEALGRRK